MQPRLFRYEAQMTNEPAARLEFPALIPAPGGAVIADAHGAVARVGLDEARRLFRSGDVLVAHALFVSGRLKAPPARPLFDAMELFAFVRPAVP